MFSHAQQYCEIILTESINSFNPSLLLCIKLILKIALKAKLLNGSVVDKI